MRRRSFGEFHAATGEPRQTVAVLRQLNLQAPFASPRMHGKNMQDQGGAVGHLAVQRLFQEALLRGREFIVGNDGVVL